MTTPRAVQWPHGHATAIAERGPTRTHATGAPLPSRQAE